MGIDSISRLAVTDPQGNDKLYLLLPSLGVLHEDAKITYKSINILRGMLHNLTQAKV